MKNKIFSILISLLLGAQCFFAQSTDSNQKDCEDYSYEFTAKMEESAKLGDYDWTLTIPSGAYIGYDNNYGRGAQFGSNNYPAKSVSLKTSDVADCSLEEVVVNASMAYDGDGRLSVYIGGAQIGDTKDLSLDATDYTFVNKANAKGDLEIRLTNTVKAMYIKSIATHVGTYIPIAVTGVTLDNSAAEQDIGWYIQLTATVVPSNADNKNVKWSSSDETVATVSNGWVTAVTPGTATITVETEDGGFTATCAITVKEPAVAVTGVTLDKIEAELEIDETVQLTATVEPENATNKNVRWSSDDRYVATVADGVVTAVAPGTATIFVETEDGVFTSTCAITVKEVEVPPTPSDCENYEYEFKSAFSWSGNLDAYYWTLNIPSGAYTGYDNNTGKGAQFGSSANPTKSVSLRTSDVADCMLDKVVVNASIGSSGDGILTVYIGGTQISDAITLTTTATDYIFYNTNNVQGDLEIRLTNTVKAMFIKSIALFAPNAVTGVTLDKNAAEMEVDGMLQLIATIDPDEATNKNVSWSSNNEVVATVDNNGLVRAIARGTAKITVKTEEGGKTATCAITVKQGEVPLPPIDCKDYNYVFTAKTEESGPLGDYNWKLTILSGVYIGYDDNKGAQFGTKTNPVQSVSFMTSDVANCLLNDVVVNASIASSGDGKLAVYIGGMQIGKTIALTTAPTDYIFYNTNNVQGDLEIRLTNTVKAMYIKSIATRINSFTPIAVTGVTLDKATASAEAGKSVTLVATVAPVNATNKKVIWSSDDETVVTVADGVVTGVAEGAATITVNTEDGNFEAKCVVTVTKNTTPIVAVTGVTLDKETASIEIGKSVTLTATVEPDDATNKEVTWVSSDETIATVADGVVTGVAEGTATITVKTVDGGFSATCVVTVFKSSDIPTKTIAEFIADKGGKCLLTGIVSNIKKSNGGIYNKYGNFDLTDESGKIYVYGLLTASGEKQQFQTLGVDEGDTLTVIAENYKLYNETDEVDDAIFVSVKKAEGVTPPQEIEKNYTITVKPNNSEWGTVTGSGTYKEQTKCTITAIPNSGYRFYRWSDGNKDNPRTVILTQDITFTAEFKEIVICRMPELDGKNGKEITQVLHSKIASHNVLSYSDVWAYKSKADYREDGTIWDMYSDCSFSANQHCGSGEFPECECYNREHTLPKSWWGHDNNNPEAMYTDLHHLVPTDFLANNIRSNYPYGEVTQTPVWSNALGSKLGYGTIGQSSNEYVFEPVDEYKGDLARIYFYMITCYSDKAFTSTSYARKYFTYTNGEAGFTPQAIELLLKWHRNDPVSTKEQERNNVVESKQGNRNPFVDEPILAEYIWGNRSSQTYLCYEDDDPEDPVTPVTPDDSDVVYYIVRFYDWDDTLLKKQSVERGRDATPPADPSRTGYKFIGWDESYTNIRSNKYIYALYRKLDESIEDIFEPSYPQVLKILRDGQILILRGEKVYTVTGQEAK